MKLRLFIFLWCAVNLMQPLRAAEAPEQEQLAAATLRSTPKTKKSSEEVQAERQQEAQTLLNTVHELLETIETNDQPLRVIAKIEGLFNRINKRLPGIVDKEALTQKYELLKAALLEKKIACDSTLAPFQIPLLPEDRATNYYPPFQEQLPTIGNQTEDFAQLTHFPCGYSPDRGWILINNGFIVNILQGSKTVHPQFLALTGQLFNGNLARATRTLALTGLTRNVASALTPDVIAKLIRLLPALSTPDECTSSYLNQLAPFFNEWYEIYNTQHHQVTGKIEAASAFRSEARDFIKLLSNCAQIDLPLTTDFLLASLALRSERTEFVPDKIALVQAFSRRLQEKPFHPLFYSENAFPQLKERYNSRSFMKSAIAAELEPLMLLLKSKQQTNFRLPLSFATEGVSDTYKGITFALCGENAVRNLISLLFYNPKTETLDLSMIPEKLQTEIHPDLKKFIVSYGKLQKPLTPTDEERAYFKKADAAWLELIENREGIFYSKKSGGISCDLEPTAFNVVLLLKQLLGASMQAVAGTPQEQFILIINSFSTPSRRLDASVKDSDPNYFICTSSFCVSFSYQLNFKINEGRHAETKFLLDTKHATDSQQTFFRTLHSAGKAMNQFLLGIIKKEPIPLLEDLIETSCLSTKEDFVTFFRNYTHQTHSCPFPHIFYLPYFLERVKNKAQHSQLYEAMQEVGFTYQGAFKESLKAPTHTTAVDWLELVTKETNYSVQESDLITLFEGIPVLNADFLYNNDNPEFKGLSYTQKLFAYLSAHHFNLIKSYSFTQGIMTPLAWALQANNLYAIEYLLKENTRPTDEQVVMILEKAATFCDREYPEYFVNIVTTLRKQGISFDTSYPFTKGLYTPIEWALSGPYSNDYKPIILLVHGNIHPSDTMKEILRERNKVLFYEHCCKHEKIILFVQASYLLSESDCIPFLFDCIHPFQDLRDYHNSTNYSLTTFIFKCLQEQKINLAAPCLFKIHCPSFKSEVMTPLSWALQTKNLYCIEYLLKAGVHPTDEQVVDILQTIAAFDKDTCHSQLASTIITLLRQLEIPLDKHYPFPKGSMTPLAWALQTDNLYAIEYLLKEGIRPTDEQVAMILEKAAPFWQGEYPDYFFNILVTLRQQGISFDKPYPFAESSCSPIEWALSLSYRHFIPLILLVHGDIHPSDTIKERLTAYNKQLFDDYSGAGREEERIKLFIKASRLLSESEIFISSFLRRFTRTSSLELIPKLIEETKIPF